MYAVEKLSSYITRGVYTVSGPFHPFGGAVDIIVVQQQDGSYKSSPWYVRFGKFQGVLKTKEKIVTICVNGEEAKFYMYLDHKGEAYFLKECDSNDSGDLEMSSPSSGDEVEENDRKLRFKKAQSCNYDKENDNGKIISRTRSKRAMLLGLMFGNTQINGDDKNTCLDRTSSLERAEIAATLLETKWSTNISSIQSTTCNDLNHYMNDNDNVGEFSNSQDVNIRDSIDLVTNLHHVEDTTQNLILATNEEIEVHSSENRSGNLDVVQENYDGEEVKSITYSETSETSTICTERTSCIEREINNLELSNSEITSIIQDSLRHSSRINSNVISPGKSSSYEPEMIVQAQETTEFSQELRMEIVDSENETKSEISENLDDVQFPFSDIHSNTIEAENKGAMAISLKGDESKEECFERIVTTSTNHTSPMTIPKSPTKFGETDQLLTKSVPIIRSQIHDLNRSNPLHTLSFSLKHNTDKSGSISSCLSLDVTSAIDDSPIDSCGEVNEHKQRIENHELISVNRDGKELNDSSEALAPNGGSWSLWPFGLKKSNTMNTECSVSESTAHEKNVNSPMRSRSMASRDEMEKAKPTKKKVKILTPTSEELASLNLNEGPNVVTYSFSTSMLGQQQMDAKIYLWKWNTRIVISDVDGTITKSDVLGQFMPLVGKDWSQSGVAHLFSAIKENEYQFLFLSARAVSQASLTRQFLFNLRQDGKALPDGPVVISPDGLFPSLYREVIRRAPHEFKIACLEDIKALFPPECNPFYAGFGNRYTDEFSYLKVGIPKGKIFIINPKGEVVVNRRVDSGSYTSLRALVDDMFPPATSEVEDYNPWNFWKLPPSDIDI